MTIENRLSPRLGQMSSRVFENPAIGIQSAIFCDIEIPIEPIEYSEEVYETSVRLEFIRFPVSAWRLLEGQAFDFPINPTDGYIDGSIYLAHTHNPVDVTRIEFGAMENGQVMAKLDMLFDFEYEGLDEFGRFSKTWQVKLSFDEAQLDAIQQSLNQSE